MSFLMVVTSIPVMSLVAFAEEISALAEADSARLELNFNKNWKFNLGDVSNAQSTAYSDKSWADVSLPHDFSIIQDFTTSGTEGESGSLPGGTGWYRKSFIMPADYAGKSVVLNFDGSYQYTTVYVNGVNLGTNRYGYNSFSYDITDNLICDGVTTNLVAVKVENPIPSSRWYSGSGIYRDVTMTIVNPVHVSLNGTSVKTPNLASSGGTDGTTKVKVTLQNDGTSASQVAVIAKIKDQSDNALAQTSLTASIAAGSSNTVTLNMAIQNPSLWSCDNPVLYTAEVSVYNNSTGELIDEYSTTYGYCWYEWTTDKGFSMNGEFMKLQGVCLHHDQGALGASQEYDAIYRQLSILKELGVNTVRTSHGTPSKAFLQVCNELGIIVMEEFFDNWYSQKNGNTYDFSVYCNSTIGSTQIIGADSGEKWYQFVVEQSVMRDHNNPCIAVWDLGNELSATEFNDTTTYADMESIIRTYDDRAITIGSNYTSIQGNGQNVDVYGGNYNISSWTSTFPAAGIPFVSTESTSALGSRGVYKYAYSDQAYNSSTVYAHYANYAGSSDYQINAYDASKVGWGATAADAWYYVITNDWFSGEYVWTGFDYIGEPTPWNAYLRSNSPYAYPNSSYFGFVDTAGFNKDSAYLYDAMWDDSDTTLHLVPGTWNSANLAVDSSGYVDVAIYSDAPYVELLYNGNVIGTATATTNTTSAGYQYLTYSESVSDSSLCKIGTLTDSNDHNFYPLFEVKYDASAEITVKAYESQGGAEITDTVGTKKLYANSASGITVSAWNNDTTLTADGDSFKYIEITAVDSNGNFVNDYNGTLNVTLTSNDGAAVIAGVDNGNPATAQKFQSSTALLSDTSAQIQMFNGKALVIVQSTEKTGSINVTVSPSGLAAKSIGLTSVAETGEELTDEFEEVIDQTVDMDNLDDDARYELLKDSVDALDAPNADVTYELYTLGSGVPAYVPDGAYIISGVDTSGTTSTGVLNSASGTTGTLTTSGSDATATSQEWSFSRQSDGTYIISYIDENITTSFLNVSASGVSVSKTSQKLTVSYSDGTVTIGDGTNYITYSASASNTAGVSTSGTALRLYTVDGTEVNRWGDVGLVEDGQYIIYNEAGYAMTYKYFSNSADTKTGLEKEAATLNGNIVETNAANEWTIRKIADSENSYEVVSSEGKYLDINTGKTSFVALSDTQVATQISQVSTGENKVVIHAGHFIYNNADTYYVIDLFTDSDAPIFCQWSNSIPGASAKANQRNALYRRVEPDSAADVSLYNALTKAMAANPNAYTDESYSDLLDAVQDGYEKYTSGTATDAEKNTATAAIDAAYAALEKSAISPTLKEDIANLDAPDEIKNGYFLYTVKSGTPIDNDVYVLYNYDDTVTNQGFLMTTEPATGTNWQSAAVTGLQREQVTPSGDEIVTTAKNEFTFTLVSSSSSTYYIQNSSGQYLNLGGSNNSLTFSDTPQAITVDINSDNTVELKYGSQYVNHFFRETNARFFSTYASNDNSSGNKFVLYKKYVDDSVDKSALYDAMQTANSANEEYYTSDTYKELQRALQEGYNVYTNDSATESEVTAATEAINQAYAALKYKNLKPMLENQIAALTPPANSTAQYGKYSASVANTAYIPDGEYVISCGIDDPNGNNPAWGVMTNDYVVDDGTWWDGTGFAATFAEPNIDSDTWKIERDTSTGYYHISRINPDGDREYLYAIKDNSDDNAQLSGTTDGTAEKTWWTAEIDPDTNKVMFRSVYNNTYLITFMGDYAYSDSNVTSGKDLYVSIYKESDNKGGTPLTLQRKVNGKLIPWYGIPVDEGKYMITWGVNGASDDGQSSLKYMTNVAVSGSTGALTHSADTSISSDNKIIAETAHEVRFEYVEDNLYYIKNGDKYLNIDVNNTMTYNAQLLTYSTTPQKIAVKAYADGRVAIYNPTLNTSNNSYIFLDKYSDRFSTWGQTMSGTDNSDYNRHFRLYSFENLAADTDVQKQLYNKLLEAIAIDQGNYSDESYNNLLVAIKDGIDSYNNDTATDAQWQAAIDAIDAAIAALEIAKRGFPATLYKYGYTPDADYSAGGTDFNLIAYDEMFNIIYNNTDLYNQIVSIVGATTETWLSSDEQFAAIEAVAYEYAKIYTLAFTGDAVTSGTVVDNSYKTFWNIWSKAGTKADGEQKNEGASVQGLFSTTLGADGLPTSHDAYDVLPYINYASLTDDNGNGVAGIHALQTKSITRNGSSVSITLPPLENISVYVPDYFSKNDIVSSSKLGNPQETYAKYYWDVQFPFVEYTNDYGVNTYVYNSSDPDRIFQASYDDNSHTATAQLTEIDTVGTGAVAGPLVDIYGQPQASKPAKGSGFFPFNNRLDGSNADMTTTENAIYHFGMSFSTEFFIPSSGSYGDGNDIVFDFSGDDDVLVYIDDVLVLDNGGLHGARSASINFTDKSVSYQYVADAETGTVTNGYSEGLTYTYGAENAGISAQNQAAIEYLNKVATDGQQHTFSFYYLERGSTDSNCKISFNIQKVSDYVKLIDQTYVVDFGLPVEFDVTENNEVSAPADYELPTYEYIGIATRIPASANSGVMFTEPSATEITQFGSLSEMEYEGNFGTYTINKNGTAKYQPHTMQFTNAGSIYLCAKVENDATYQDGQVYYMFEKVTIVPATSIYFEDDFEGNGITYTDGTIPSIETNTNNYGVWQNITETLPTGVVKGEIYQAADEAGDAAANPYGYDGAYSDCAMYSGYSAKYVSVSAKNNPNSKYSGGTGSSWPKAEFTFAGTGFDLISVTSKDTGAINLTVADANGDIIRNHTVNTYYGYTYGQLYKGAGGNPTLTDTGIPLYFTADRSYTATPTYYAADGTIVTENTGDLEPAYAMGWITESAVEEDNALYQIPVIKVSDLDYGTYTITITPMYSSRMDIAKDGAYEFYIDAVRVYNPAGVGDTLTNATISYTYTQDKEANADYLELRDMLIGSNQLTDGTSAEGVVFIDGIADNDDVSKYTSGGPNNELYLLKDQAVAFEIWASAIPDDVQISAKAVGDTQPEMFISYATTAGTYTAKSAVKSSTDLYYSIDGLLRQQSVGQLNWTPVTGADGNTYYTSDTVVIQNISDGIISITNLKWTFPSAGIGYFENLQNGGAEVVSEEPVMLMSSYSTFRMARSAVRATNADLEIGQDDVAVENNSVTAGESIKVNVSTSTDVDTLIIRDENGNVITPEALESYVETIDNEEVKQWTVTLSEDDAGTYTYFITGAYENGLESETPVEITVTVEEIPEAEDNTDADTEENLTFFEKLVGFFEKILDFFRQLVLLLTGV
ncbi:MAG: hypothetical protein IJ289_08740 [Clostridia bacterium]|nr:hypothetical protein [Clostridia bacterium]